MDSKRQEERPDRAYVYAVEVPGPTLEPEKRWVVSFDLSLVPEGAEVYEYAAIKKGTKVTGLVPDHD